jgi:hypothetical protein
MSKKKSTPPPPPLSPENYIRKNSRNLPLYKCFINEDWEENNMGNVFIVRKHVTGNVTTCIYLVDLACLGVKDTFFRFNVPFVEIEGIMEKNPVPFIEISYDMAHNIIYAALEFAEEYGFKPHKDFTSITSHFLEEDTDDIPIIEIECGKDGKPMYVNSGYETAARQREILAQLERTAGEGNYHFLLRTDADGNLHDNNEDGDEYDDDEYDEEDEAENKRCIKEIVRLDKNEQRRLFQELLKELESDEDDIISEKNYRKLIILTRILPFDLVNKETIDEQIEIFENKFANEFVEDDILPNSLFAEIQGIDGKTLTITVDDVFEAIMKNNEPREAIQLFRDKVGEAPIAYFMELYHLNHIKDKEFEQKLEEYHQKYPHYFLIQLFYLTHLLDKNVPEVLDALFLQQTHPITELEATFFFHLYTYSLIADKKTDLSILMAFEEFIVGFEFFGTKTSETILSALFLAKTKKVNEDIEQNGL